MLIIFLSISINMCFGCSKEPSHWDGSFEYPQHMFWMRNKENNFPIHTLIWRPGFINRCFWTMPRTEMPTLDVALQEYERHFSRFWGHDPECHIFHHKARIFLLVDLREFFFRFRVGGTKKNKIKKLWKWPVNWSFSELFFFFSDLFFFLISPEKQ